VRGYRSWQDVLLFVANAATDVITVANIGQDVVLFVANAATDAGGRPGSRRAKNRVT